jgi:hypothetical protein
LAVVAVYAHIKCPSVGSRLRLIAALGTLATGMLISSMLGEFGLPLLAAGAVWWRERRSVPWTFIAIALAVAVLLQPVKHYYRTIHWYNSQGETVTEAWQEAFRRAKEAGEDESAFLQTHRRVADLTTLAYTIDVVPRLVPHTNGMSYEAIAVGFVPRLIWPDKPNMTKIGADAFTIPLGLNTEEASDYNSVGISIPAHGYMEHGFVGALAFTAMLGALFGLSCRIGGDSAAGTLLTTVLGVPLTSSMGGGFVTLCTSYPKSLLLAAALVWLLYTIARVRSPQRRTTSLAHDPAWRSAAQ